MKSEHSPKALYKQLEQASSREEQLPIMLSLVKTLGEGSNGKADTILQDIKAIWQQEDNALAEVYYRLGHAWLFWLRSRFDEAMESYNRAYVRAEQLQRPVLMADALRGMGITDNKAGRSKAAIKKLQQALQLFLDNNAPADKIGVCYNNIGLAYVFCFDRERARPNYIEAIKWLKKAERDDLVESVYGNLGVLLYESEKYDEAIHYFFEILERFRSESRIQELILTHYFIGRCYAGMQNYAEALSHYVQANKLLKDQPFELLKAQVFHGLGDLYILMKGYDEAEEYLLEAINLRLKAEHWKYACNTYQGLIDLYASLGEKEKYRQALNKALALAKEHELAHHIQLFESYFAKEV